MSKQDSFIIIRRASPSYFFVYILKLIDNSYYCGITNNLDRRIKEHSKGKRGYVARIGFKELIWYQVVDSRKLARYLEVRIKRYGVKKYLVYLRVNKKL